MLLIRLSTVALLLTISECEEGSCPPTLSVNVCHAGCGPRNPCSSPQLCCPTTCGGSTCVDPMTKRHFVDLVKKGRCPEIPKGPWVCSHMCTTDADCLRALKCCTNRCGVLTCQQPKLDSVDSHIEHDNREN